MTDRLVCYSLAHSTDAPHMGQMLRSIASLRRYNATVPVRVFAYGELPEQAGIWLDSHHVEVWQMGAYAGRLRQHSRHAEPLSTYPVLPKYLSLAELAGAEVSQLLWLDCDTFFFDDVDKLFQRYQVAEWYGREEPFTVLSAHFDPGYLDPAALAALVESEGLRAVPTLNTGALLLNYGLQARIAPLLGSMLDYVSRFQMWLSDPRNYSGELPFTAPGPDHGLLPLPFPSSNVWIADEVAFWLALGRLPRLTSGVFAWQDFLQGQEFLATERKDTPAIACHYYTVNEDQFCDWLDLSEAAMG